MGTTSIDGILLGDELSEVTLEGGRYTVTGRLGSGGMARVYHAWDRHLNVWRAIKLLSARRTRRRQALDRFEREARLMAGIDHPHVVRVYDFDWHEGRPYIVMEAVSGGSLWDWMDRHHRPLHPLDAIRMASAVCRALSVAHARGVIHRDLKPNNVLIAEGGRFKLTDFGVALLRGHARERRGARLGTDGFLAPEQEVDPGCVDERADIYGVGATLYAVLTGLRPRQLHQADRDDSVLRPVPERLRPVIARATAYRAEDRHPDALALLRELDALLLEMPRRPADLPPIYACQVETPGLHAVPTGPTILRRQRARVAGASTVPLPEPRDPMATPLGAAYADEAEPDEDTFPPREVTQESELAAGAAGFMAGAAVVGVAAAVILVSLALL